MTYEWTIGTYTDERAKSVIAHADAGIGYFIQNRGGAGKAFTVTAAFRRPQDSILPDNCIVANYSQVIKLDRMFDSRQGGSNKRHSTFSPGIASVSQVASHYAK